MIAGCSHNNRSPCFKDLAAMRYLNCMELSYTPKIIYQKIFYLPISSDTAILHFPFSKSLIARSYEFSAKYFTIDFHKLVKYFNFNDPAKISLNYVGYISVPTAKEN